MTFNERDRRRLAELADVLIPTVGSHMSASQADVASGGLDQVLATCAEMESALQEVLALASEGDAVAAVAKLREKHAGAFGVLCEFAAGAYFLNPTVREAIGYAGQTARAIDPRPDYLDDGLLESVIRRGAIFRATQA